jgi:FSR family fosmidomycin resistance protein-like MFS transporter
MPRKAPSIRSRLTAVSFLHFYNDLHASFLPTLLPDLIRRLSLSLAEAGTLNSLFGAMHMLVQPVAGRLADRTGRPIFVLWGPAVTALGACLIPFSPSPAAAFAFVFLFGLGTASFHPQGHGLAGRFSPSERLSFTLACFGAAGTLGAALSPLYAIALLDLLGPNGIPWAASTALPLFLLLPLVSAPHAGEAETRGEETSPAQAPATAPERKPILPLLRKIGPLLGLALLRDSTSQGFRVFLPLWIVQRGGTLVQGGTALFLFTLAGTLTAVAGARIADRWGKRATLRAVFLMAPLFLIGGTLLSGRFGLATLILGGAILSGSSSITTAIAQERAPEDRSLVSSLVMGVAWGVANLLTAPIGALADRLGLTITFLGVAFVPWFGLPLLREGTRGPKSF